MDVITGFPGEMDAEFEAGFEELARLPWSRLHVFPYSEREGTPATRLPGTVRPEVRAARAKRLAELSLERIQAHAGRALDDCTKSGKPLQGVLLEKPSAKAPAGWQGEQASSGEPTLWANGYTANYLRVFFPIRESEAVGLRNQIVSADPVAVITDRAQGDSALVARPRNNA
jgi:hypothetical protein